MKRVTTSLGAAIRELYQQKTAYLLEVNQKEQELVNSCLHDFSIVLCSSHRGSYSWDYDDAHDEVRQCLVCGTRETGPKFTKLLKPQYRFEFGGDFFKANGKFFLSPFAEPRKHTLRELQKYCEQHGYKP